MSPKRTLTIALAILATLTTNTHARTAQTPEPQPIPAALARARAACPATTTIVQCRGRLREAYAAVAWQKGAREHTQAMTVQAITRDAIAWAAARYGVNPAQMVGIGLCESHLWPFAVNGQYKGWAQLGARHLTDPIFSVVPWQDAYATASHVARYIKAHGEGEWQCVSTGGLRW